MGKKLGGKKRSTKKKMWPDKGYNLLHRTYLWCSERPFAYLLLQREEWRCWRINWRIWRRDRLNPMRHLDRTRQSSGPPELSSTNTTATFYYRSVEIQNKDRDEYKPTLTMITQDWMERVGRVCVCGNEANTREGRHTHTVIKCSQGRNASW
jgi:hypothetical protein